MVGENKVIEAKKTECANALKEIKLFCKKFGVAAGILKGSLTKGSGEQQ